MWSDIKRGFGLGLGGSIGWTLGQWLAKWVKRVLAVLIAGAVVMCANPSGTAHQKVKSSQPAQVEKQNNK